MKSTRARRAVLGLLIFHYANSYMDRVAIAGAAPFMREELGLGEVGLGAVFAAFSLSYALFQLPWGWLADRFGPRRVLTVIVCFWSTFTMATAAAWNAGSLLAIRFLFGIGEAGGFPAATRAMSKWFPPSERGFTQGVTHTGARVGGAITLPLAVWIGHVSSWRVIFLVFGLIGLAWAVVWYRYYRDRPEDHPGVNATELATIRGVSKLTIPTRDGSGDGTTQPEVDRVPWRVLLRNRNMQLICVMYGGTVYTGWIYFSWFPTYLVETRGFGIVESGLYGSLPLWVGAIANSVGGWLSDRLVMLRGLRFGRRSVAITGLTAAVVFMMGGALAADSSTALILLILAAGALELTVGVSWAVTIDVGSQFPGTVSALMNSSGNLAGALSPLVFGILVAWIGSWAAPFILASALLLVSAVCWWWIDPERSVVE